ncbi:MAG: FAD-dependent oxidoreductase [Candidatus Peregrinibacteria bacterium]
MALQTAQFGFALDFSKKPAPPKIFDVLIIGAGPAGMTAAVYASRRKMTIGLLCGHIGGQMMWSSDIENYTGVKQATGPELTSRFYSHIKKVHDDSEHFDLWVMEDQYVKTISGNFEEHFTITTEKGDTYTARTVVCTSGKIPKTLHVPGEEIAMKGNGLSFCATCDAPLYKDKKMVVLGGGNSAMDVVLQLQKFTDDITLITNIDHLIGEEVMMGKITMSPRVTVKYSTLTHEILLNEQGKVRAVLVSTHGGEQYEIACDGIFEEIGQMPATQFLEGFLPLNEGKEIPINRRCETSVKGFFAAGDCSDEPHKQVIVATGQGAIAALEAHELLLRPKFQFEVQQGKQ